MVRRAQARGCDLTGGVSALCVKPGEGPTGGAARGRSPPSAPTRSPSSPAGGVYVLLPGTTEEARRLTGRLGARGIVALSSRYREATDARLALEEADLLLTLAEAGGLGSADTPSWDSIRILFRTFVADPDELARFSEETVGALVRHDEQQGSELQATFWAYQESNCNMNLTAKATFTHRHTVSNRLARIEELTGLDPSQSYERELLSMALKAHYVIAMSRPRGNAPGLSGASPQAFTQRNVFHSRRFIWRYPADRSRVGSPAAGRQGKARKGRNQLRKLCVISAVGCVAVLAALGLSACGDSSEDSSAGGGTLRVTYNAFPDYLDPALSYTLEGWTAMYDTYIPLLTYAHAEGDAGSEVIPGLAEALPKVSDGGKTYTLVLRQGLKYSDGTPVRASDFKHVDRTAFELSSPASTFYTDIVGAERFAETKKGGIAGIETDDESGEIVDPPGRAARHLHQRAGDDVRRRRCPPTRRPKTSRPRRRRPPART